MKISVSHYVVLTTISAAFSELSDVEFLLDAVLKEFKNVRMNLVCDKKLVRQAMHHSGVLISNSIHTWPGESLIFCAEEGDSPSVLSDLLRQNKENAVGKTWIIIGSSKNLHNTIKNVLIDINRLVLFLNTDNYVMEEIYHINNEPERKVVAKINPGNANIIWSGKKITNIYHRSNLNSMSLKAIMSKNWYPTIYYHPKNMSNVKWRKDGSGASWANVSQENFLGTFAESLKILETDLNFTTSMKMTKKKGIGFPKIKNGTLAGWTGLIGELYAGRTDMLLISAVNTLEKHGVLSFLHQMDTHTLGLVTSVEAGNEENEWLMYLMPFKGELWQGVYLASILFIGILFINQLAFKDFGEIFNYMFLSESFLYYWMMLFTFFGLPTRTYKRRELISFEKSLIACLFCGTVTFISYRAALTSKLSIKHYSQPFSSPEGLYESNFRFVLNRINLILVSMQNFQMYFPFNRLVHNWRQMENILKQYKGYTQLKWIARTYEKQNDSGYVKTFEKSLREVVVPYSRKACIGYIDRIRLYPNLKCQLSVVWKVHQPIPKSVVMGYKSPFFQIINHVWLKRTESGIRSRIVSKGYDEHFDLCAKESEGNSLGQSTIVGIHIVLAIGMLMSLCLLVLEIIMSRCNCQRYRSLPGISVSRDSATHFAKLEQESTEYALGRMCIKWGPQNPSGQADFLAELSGLLHASAKVNDNNYLRKPRLNNYF